MGERESVCEGEREEKRDRVMKRGRCISVISGETLAVLGIITGLSCSLSGDFLP